MLKIKPLALHESMLLREMLYHAIYLPPGAAAPPRSIVDEPTLKCYVENWGRPGDMAFVAWDKESAVGAAWLRLWLGAEKGYGYIAENIPELSIALVPLARGQGTGTRLMQTLLPAASALYPGVSLSVSPDNPARRLYERMGFTVFQEKPDSLLMLCQFNTPGQSHLGMQIKKERL